MENPTVQASHLGKAFGATRVLHDLSFTVAPGDVIGVLGKNGAGKTTLLELMLGYSLPTEGEVCVFGHSSSRLPGQAKARVGFVPQQDELLNHLNVTDQLGVISSFYKHWDHELMARLCQEWDIRGNARIKSMSVGERQKLSILIALGHRPDLLILDEPVASLDPIARRQFLEQLVEVSADGGRCIIFSSHIVSDIERLANRIWILKEGRLFWQGDLDSLKESIVRIHLQGSRPLSDETIIPGAISVQRDALFATAVVRDWSETSQQELERRISGPVRVQPLGLEEIFLELHR
jgi:ABC-2 type transport system ATP-binding protein